MLKLITQLFGDRMMIANATGCSSIWGGSVLLQLHIQLIKKDMVQLGLTHYLKIMLNLDYGMFLGVKTIRERIADNVTACS